MRSVGSLLLLMLGAATARAEETAQQLTVPRGKVVVDAFVDMNLSSGRALDPVSISPDIWYGVTDDVTLGLVHSTPGQFGFVSEPFNNSLCLGGSCPGLYDNVALGGRFRLAPPFAVDATLLFAGLSDFTLLGRLGVAARWVFGKVIVETQPSLVIVGAGRDNLSDSLQLPVTGAYAISPSIQLGVQTGLLLPFENAGDDLVIPISLLGRYRVDPRLSLGLAFTLLNLNSQGIDARSLTLGASYAR
jgi:hypothetical protein